MMNWKGYGSVCSKIKLLSQYLPGRTKGGKKKKTSSQDSWYPRQDLVKYAWLLREKDNIKVKKLNSSYYVG
jgi:hypothetical protein